MIYLQNLQFRKMQIFQKFSRILIQKIFKMFG